MIYCLLFMIFFIQNVLKKKIQDLQVKKKIRNEIILALILRNYLVLLYYPKLQESYLEIKYMNYLVRMY